jgi:hypothetical protein
MSGKHVRTGQHQACVLPSDTKSAIDVHRCDGMDRQPGVSNPFREQRRALEQARIEQKSKKSRLGKK